MTDWTPQVGDRVMAVGTVIEIDLKSTMPIRVRCDHGEYPTYFTFKELSPLPAQREPWEVVLEAVQIAEKRSWFPVVTQSMRMLAAELEAVAPKPPTLAEAVRAWFEKPSFSRTEAMKEALARAEAGQ